MMTSAQTDWANSGGQTAWQFLFSLQMRIVLASIITALIAELIDTWVYRLWSRGRRVSWPQWTRVFASNSISIPVDSLLFPVIAFAGETGRSTAAHLHFGVMIAGRFRDPVKLLKNISPRLAQKR